MTSQADATALLNALRSIAKMPDRLHRETLLDAVEDELRRLRRGCRCERLLNAAVVLPNDAGEGARVLLRRLHADVTVLCEYRGPRDGLAAGLAVEAERLTRLAGMCEETDSD